MLIRKPMDNQPNTDRVLLALIVWIVGIAALVFIITPTIIQLLDHHKK